MDRRKFLQAGAAVGAGAVLAQPTQMQATVQATMLAATQAAEAQLADRPYWVALAAKIAAPVLGALSERRLKIAMPVEAPTGNVEVRRKFAHLEAFARLLTGMTPWLEARLPQGAEEDLRAKLVAQVRAALDAATDPASPDRMNFSEGDQPVVDAAFLALAILRAPNELWMKVEPRVQKNLISALEFSRGILPGYSNWLLFSAMIEGALAKMGAWWDPMRIDYAVRTVNTWYKGDGIYGDGPEFHFDYYNSFVIHPMLLNLLEAMEGVSGQWKPFQPEMLRRARRYAAIQERLIGPEGSFPPVGRSLCYRFGAFHLLAEMALRRQLPEGMVPAQVRCALTAVMRRMMDAPGTFDEQGWLRIGFHGHQPQMAESYISTGSSYLCSAAWLPLGLPPTDPFWAADAEPWTAKKAWSGAQIAADHALRDGHSI